MIHQRRQCFSSERCTPWPRGVRDRHVSIHNAIKKEENNNSTMCIFSTAVYILRCLFDRVQHRKHYSRRLEMQMKSIIYWVCVRTAGHLCGESLHGRQPHVAPSTHSWFLMPVSSVINGPLLTLHFELETDPQRTPQRWTRTRSPPRRPGRRYWCCYLTQYATVLIWTSFFYLRLRESFKSSS